MYDTTVVLSIDTNTVWSLQRCSKFLRARKTAFNSKKLYGGDFICLTKCLLQCSPLSVRPSLCLRHLLITAEHGLGDGTADPGVRFSHPTTNSDVDGEIWVLGPSFPKSPECASVSSDATVWVSCEGDLTRPVFLWLSEGLSGT